MGRPPLYTPGQTFFYWTIIRHVAGSSYYLCRCVCGVEREVRSLSSGQTKSCGCMRGKVLAESYARKKKFGIEHPSRKHGLSQTREYRSYKHMLNRCLNPKNDSYKIYGGRGITIHPSWQGKDGFTKFLKDMGLRPENTSLDRINPNGNYEPSNCRWADPKTQIENRRAVVQISLERLRALEAIAKKAGVDI